MPPTSVSIAPPESTAHRISTITASPYPLYPPSGIGKPSDAILGSVVGLPSESMAQPAGMDLSPLSTALKILLSATVVVAISKRKVFGPGTAMQIGLVPNIFSRPCQGATSGDALHITMPMYPADAIFRAHHAHAPKCVEFRTVTRPMPPFAAMRMA